MNTDMSVSVFMAPHTGLFGVVSVHGTCNLGSVRDMNADMSASMGGLPQIRAKVYLLYGRVSP